MLSKVAGQLLFFAITCLQLSGASTDRAKWLYPPKHAGFLFRFESQDTLDAAWTSVFAAPVLIMVCQLEEKGAAWKTVFQSPTPVLPNGSCSIPLGPAQNLGCHLTLNETTGALMGNRSDSGDFVVGLQSDRSPITWSTSTAETITYSSTPTPTPTPTPVSPITPTSILSSSTSTTSPSSTASASIISSTSAIWFSSSGTPTTAATSATSATSELANLQTKYGLSNALKACIGVGVTLGILALVLASLLAWMRKRTKTRQVPLPGPLQQQNGMAYTSEENANHESSETEETIEEKDGYPIATTGHTAGELEADTRQVQWAL